MSGRLGGTKLSRGAGRGSLSLFPHPPPNPPRLLRRRSVAVVEQYFEEYALRGQDILGSPERWDKVLALVPEDILLPGGPEQGSGGVGVCVCVLGAGPATSTVSLDRGHSTASRCGVSSRGSATRCSAGSC